MESQEDRSELQTKAYAIVIIQMKQDEVEVAHSLSTMMPKERKELSVEDMDEKGSDADKTAAGESGGEEVNTNQELLQLL